MPESASKGTIVRPAPQRLRELLRYCPETGELFWKVSGRGRMRPGDPAGSMCHTGYKKVGIDGWAYLCHRVIWAMVYDEWPSIALDHADRNSLNNRIENLREATHSQNGANRARFPNNKSGFKGVFYYAKFNKFVATIVVNRKRRRLGLFDTAEGASEAYTAASKAAFGEFHCDDQHRPETPHPPSRGREERDEGEKT